MAWEQVVEGKRGVAVEECGRGVGRSQVVDTGRQWWRRGVRGLCKSAGYMAGVGADVEDSREVAFDVLKANISLSVLEVEVRRQYEQSLCQSSGHLIAEIVDLAATFWIRR